MSAHVLISVSTKSIEYIVKRLKVSFVGSLSHDFIGVSSLVRLLEAVLFWGQDVPASSRFLLVIVAEWVDSTCDQVTCYEFVRHVEVALSRMVTLTTCCSTRIPSAAGRPLMVGGAAILSRSCLMVWIALFVSCTISLSWACWLTTWFRSMSVGLAAVSFLGLWGVLEAWGWFWLPDGWFCTWLWDLPFL